jgi:hypothetical protein
VFFQNLLTGIKQNQSSILLKEMENPKNDTYSVEVIDSWNRKRYPQIGTFSGRASIKLLSKSYTAVLF